MTMNKSKKPNQGLCSLPTELLIKILSNLSTKDSIRTSALSKQWEKLWLQVPVLELNSRDFEDRYELDKFYSKFVEFNKNLHLKRFKLICDGGGDDVEEDCEIFTSLIDDVVERNVCHLTVVYVGDGLLMMPLSLYSCATLVDVTLYGVLLPNPKSKLVSLPCVKTMHLELVKFDGDKVLKTLIPGCSVLQQLCIITYHDDYFKKLCVRSQSLRQFKLEFMSKEPGNPDGPNVEIDAPKLESLSIINYYYRKLILLSVDPSAKVNLDVTFDDEYLNNPVVDSVKVRHFLRVISRVVCELTFSARTLKEILSYAELYELLPQFCNLSCLHVSCHKSSWNMLHTFLQCCPNLHSLDLEFGSLPKTKNNILPYVHQPQGFLSTLEVVQLKPKIEVDTSSKKNVATYFIRNCKALKELTLNESYTTNIIEYVRKIPKRSPVLKLKRAKKVNVVSHRSSIFKDVFVPKVLDL